MKSIATLWSMVCLCVVLTASTNQARSLYEKKMYFVSDNNVETCGYWAIFLGTFPCDIKRTFPGEPEVTLHVEFNVSVLSNMFMEAKGYSDRGPISSDPTFIVVTPQGEKTVDIAQILCAYERGAKVRLTDSTAGDLFLNIEGNRMPVQSLLLRKYSMSEAETLTLDADIPLRAFAFTPEGISHVIPYKEPVKSVKKRK